MKIIIGTLLFTLAVFLNSIGLSSQSVRVTPEQHARRPNIRFYADLNNHLQRIGLGDAVLVANDNFIIGIDVEGIIRPVFDAARQMVLVRLADYQNVPMIPQIAQEYGFIQPHPAPASTSGQRRPGRRTI